MCVTALAVANEFHDHLPNCLRLVFFKALKAYVVWDHVQKAVLEWETFYSVAICFDRTVTSVAPCVFAWSLSWSLVERHRVFPEYWTSYFLILLRQSPISTTLGRLLAPRLQFETATCSTYSCATIEQTAIDFIWIIAWRKLTKKG